MATKFLGQVLLEKGLLNSSQLLQVLDEQKKCNLTLGDVAIQKGFLTEKEATSINLEQQRTDKRFGEIAIDKGLMDEEKLNIVLDAQKQTRKFFGEIIVSMGFLDQQTVDKELALQKEAQQKAEKDYQHQLEEVPYKNIVNSFLNITSNLFTRMPQEFIKTDSLYRQSHQSDGTSHYFIQKINGPVEFYYVLALPEAMMLRIASKTLMMEHNVVDELTLDANCEFVNIITGNACVKLSTENLALTMEPPKACEKSTVYPESKETVIVEANSQKGTVQIGLLFL